jgi:hypothetical protein
MQDVKDNYIKRGLFKCFITGSLQVLWFRAVRNQEQQIPVNICNDIRSSANIARFSPLLKLFRMLFSA